MKKTIKLLLVGALLIFLCNGVWAQKSELKFSHSFHIENEVECLTCHSSVENSTTGTDNLFPSMEVCSDCHDVEDEAECTTCHSNVDNAGEGAKITQYMEKFSHKKHLTANLECSNCHAGVLKSDKSGEQHLPDMKQCMDCHESRSVSKNCMVCHSEKDELKPVTHHGDFKHHHGQLARSMDGKNVQMKSCTTCHSDDYCQKCHEGENIDRMTHALNFEFTHSFAARGKEQECLTCHTERTFCIECHSERHIRPQNHDKAGWINNVNGGLHKSEAEVNLESCMACHENNADVFCQPCHDNN